jgi:hypothetical protein
VSIGPETKLDSSDVQRVINNHFEPSLKSLARSKDPESTAIRLALIRAYFMTQRLAASHPFLVERFLRKRLNMEQIQTLRESLSKMGKVPVYQQMGPLTKIRRENTSESGSESSTETPVGPIGTSNFGGYFNMGTMLELAETEIRIRGERCMLCPEPKSEPEQNNKDSCPKAMAWPHRAEVSDRRLAFPFSSSKWSS